MRSKFDNRTREALQEIGVAIRVARREVGMSQEQLAETISMGRENLGKIERAEINVTVDTLVRIAAGLGMTLSVGLVPRRSRVSRR